ncbi:hypothetical protein QBC44DRAFT_367867 [Cladorrhinum sp. PSN332]|nr:hypothetical protein QBC44DRAFT_367867 [Cladorrhinum sp. PSN332]
MSNEIWISPAVHLAPQANANIPVKVLNPSANMRMASFGKKIVFPLSPSATEDFDTFILPCLVKIFAGTQDLKSCLPRVKEIKLVPCRLHWRSRFWRRVKEANALVIEVAGRSREAIKFAKAAKGLIDRSGACTSEAIENKFEVFVQDEPAQWTFT